MLSSTVNICVFALVLLSIQHTCHSRPQNRYKREIIKDYFTPLILSPKEFEKGEDGKFYLKKSAHRSDSAVNYVNVENIDDESRMLENDLKAANDETIKDETEIVLVEKLMNVPENEMAAGIEDSEKAKVEVSSSPPYLEEVKIVKEIIPPKSETVKAKNIEINKEKAPFEPVDPKFMISSKPDSKDEIAIKTDLLPVEEEKIEEKVTIGQVPYSHSRVIPIPTNFRIPLLIPIRKISYGSVSVRPLPPTEVSDRLPFLPADISDRLPLPPSGASDRILPFALDDIVGEGEHESASLEPAAGEKKDTAYPETIPLAIRVQLPFLSFSGLLKDLKDTNKEDGEKQSKVVDVLGKKFLMQTNVVKYPSDDNSQTFVRFMSVKPLEGNDPAMTKEAAVEEGIKGVIKETDRKEIEAIDMKKEIEEIDMKKKIEFDENDMKKKEIDMKKEIEQIDMKKKEIDIKKEIEQIDMKNKEMEDIDMKKKEIEQIDMKKKEMEDIDTKKKEMEDIDMKKKEMEDIDMKKKEMEDIDMKKKEMEDIDMKKKDFEAEGEIFIAEEKLVDIEKGKEAALAKTPEILKVEESQISVKVDPIVPKDIVMKEIGISEIGEEKSEDPFVKEMKIKKVFESDLLEKSLKSAEEEEIKESKAIEDKVVTGMESLEGVLKKEMGKEMDVISKEELFLVDNKKKIKIEVGDVINPKKKIEKKKKKCKCEEEDSDSDDD